MNKTQKKIKLLQPKRSGKRSGTVVSARTMASGTQAAQTETSASKEAALEAAEVSAFWRDEITLLQGRNFSSATEAIDYLVERVLDRLHLKKPERSETREYLLVLFETDPELQEEIAEVLSVKG